MVSVPAGAYDGQRISVQESGGPDGPPMTLTLALAVMQTIAPGVPDNTERTMRASNPEIVPPKNPAVTPYLGQTPIPPPPPGFQQSWTPVPNPPSQPPVPDLASWTPVQNLETQAPTVRASNPNLQQQQTVREFSPPVAPATPLSTPAIPRRGAKWRNALLVGLALLLVLSGLGIITLVPNGQVASDKANATATAQARAQANARATTFAVNATGTADANAFATQIAIYNSQATATVAASQNLYNASTSGAPALNDPLSDNSRGYGWAEGTSTSGGGCQFTGGVYRDTIPNNSFLGICTASSPNFANFAFSVLMKIAQGYCGGMLFRGADVNNGKFYYWRVCQDGSYGLFLYTSSSGNTKTLLSSTTSTLNTGLNQSNLITVIAKGHTLYFYVNKQEIDNVSDGTYNQGQIGLTAESLSSTPTDVVYTNAEVWML